MIFARRLLNIFAILALPFALGVPDAVAARHHVRHVAAHRTHRATQVVTTVYQVTTRPHATHRLRAARAGQSHFAQSIDRGLMPGS